MPKTVRGIITQGARGLEGSTSAENRAFVRKYKLAHSLTGKDWTYITDSKTGLAKVKGGEHRPTDKISLWHIHMSSPRSDCHCQFSLICSLFIAVFQRHPSPLSLSFPASLRLSHSLLTLSFLAKKKKLFYYSLISDNNSV